MSPVLATKIKKSEPLFRVTSPAYYTPDPQYHKKVVNGQGAVRNYAGGRYNYPGASTVYLAEKAKTSLCEYFYYFHREYLKQADVYEIDTRMNKIPMIPVFLKQCVIWEIQFKTGISDVATVSESTAGTFSVFPLMLTSPSRDYEHLKDRRAFLQNQGYNGLLAPSSRDPAKGNVVVIFGDQSKNVKSIVPYTVDLRLIQPNGRPFYDPRSQLLHFSSGQVRIRGTTLPRWAKTYSKWKTISFLR